MKIKYIAVGLICSLFLNVCLIININNKMPECERVHTDDINRAVNVIPDEKAALKIAKLILTDDSAGKFKLNESCDYHITITYDEVLDEWCVSFLNKNTNILDTGGTIWLSGSYGIMNNFRW